MKKKTPDKFAVYTIKKGDTLATVAAFFEKSQQEIKGFHNVFCEEDDLIVIDFPKSLTQLYVYPYLHYKAIGVSEHMDQSTSLRQKKQETIANYTVQFLATEGEKRTIVDFEISLTHKAQVKQGHVYVISKISPTTLNGELDLNDTEEVKEKIVGIVYPLEVLVHDNGTWQEIIYDKAITKRFKALQSEIKDFYKGPIVHNMMAHAQEVISNEENFKKVFAHNWLLDSIFSNIYRYYNHQEPIKETFKFALLDSVPPLQFEIEQNIGEFIPESKLVTINRQGTLNDPRTRADFEKQVLEPRYDGKGAVKAAGRFEQKITLNMQTFALESIYLHAEIELQTPRSVEIKIRRY
jgi:hypothetical protein